MTLEQQGGEMTTDEREELRRLRDLEEVLNSFEQLEHVRRLVELERMDAAQGAKCAVCEIEANTEEAIKDGTLPILDLAKYEAASRG